MRMCACECARACVPMDEIPKRRSRRANKKSARKRKAPAGPRLSSADILAVVSVGEKRCGVCVRACVCVYVCVCVGETCVTEQCACVCM